MTSLTHKKETKRPSRDRKDSPDVDQLLGEIQREQYQDRTEPARSSQHAGRKFATVHEPIGNTPNQTGENNRDQIESEKLRPTKTLLNGPTKEPEANHVENQMLEIIRVMQETIGEQPVAFPRGDETSRRGAATTRWSFR